MIRPALACIALASSGCAVRYVAEGGGRLPHDHDGRYVAYMTSTDCGGFSIERASISRSQIGFSFGKEPDLTLTKRRNVTIRGRVVDGIVEDHERDTLTVGDSGESWREEATSFIRFVAPGKARGVWMTELCVGEIELTRAKGPL